MKIQVNTIPEGEEEAAFFHIHEINDRVLQAIRILNCEETDSLLCKQGDAHYKISIDKILYLESVDRKVFVYTQKETLEIPERLYALEERLSPFGFCRVSKSMLLNIEKIYSFYPKFSGNLEALLINKEKVTISRRYVQELKRKLGMEEEE